MEIFVLLVLIGVVTVRWFMMREKLRRLEEQIAQLAGRVVRLEKVSVSESAVEDNVAPTPPGPVLVRDVTPPIPSGLIPQEEPKAATAFVPGDADRQPSVPSLNFIERLRSGFGGEEWEALVGGGLLNMIGAVVLVIGVALFLGYSFTHMTPTGRALTAFGVSLSLLGGGLFLERKPSYRRFAGGLIGAGWAVLYITVYAIYAVPATRLINDPYIGSLLLLLVAGGMIGHSLLYRVQAITAVAYFASFAALGVTPSSLFGMLSLIPLSVSFLYLAWKFRWDTLAVFGVVATYSTCVWRGESAASLLEAESLLLVYWSLFEAFDLLRVQRRASGTGLEFVFPLNAIGFLGLSYRAVAAHSPGHLVQAYTVAATLYLVSALIRGFLWPRQPFSPQEELASRMRKSSYEAPTAIAAVLTGLAISARLVGVWLGAGLAIEAEILYLAGVFLDLAFLRTLGGIGFAFSLGRLVTYDVASEQTPTLLSRHVHAWTAPALFHAGLFYGNRALYTRSRVYSSLATALTAGVLLQELPTQWAGLAWVVFGATLFEIGVRRWSTEFRLQAYVLAAAGSLITITRDLVAATGNSWIPLAGVLALVYVFVLRLRFATPIQDTERKWFDGVAGSTITTLALLLTRKCAPEHFVGVLSCALAIVLFELGARRLPRSLVYLSYVTAALGSVVLICEQSPDFLKFAPVHVWISYSVSAICLYFFAERVSNRQLSVRVLASLAAAVFALCALWVRLPDNMVDPAWAALALMLFFSGLHRALPHERWQGYLVMLVAVLMAWTTSVHVTTLVVVLSCYLAQLSSPIQKSHIPKGWFGHSDKYSRVFWSLLGTLSLTMLLWREFPGGLVTIAWGLEGLVLLGTGFPLRDRVLRLEGLAMLLVCILKLFLYDLRNLETVYRILSFVALGLILLVTSSVYTRFRERLKQYL